MQLNRGGRKEQHSFYAEGSETGCSVYLQDLVKLFMTLDRSA